jgi:hypothetical protein
MGGAPTVLMMGEGMRKASHLEDFLRRSGWNCRVEPEMSVALQLAEQNPYDLVLSGVRMDRAHRGKLVNSLMKAKASLFFSMAVEYGCWWLPAVRLGENCADSPALPSKRFAEEIERLRVELLLQAASVHVATSVAVATTVGARSRDNKRLPVADKHLAYLLSA